MIYYILYPFFFLIGILPSGAKRAFSQFLYFVVYRVIKYRVSVVNDNLVKAFPEKSEKQIKEIQDKFYYHLSDVILETIEMTTVNLKKLEKRIEFINADQIEHYTSGKSWISVMAHYGSWEYTTMWGLYSKHDHVLAAYRPLASKVMDSIFHRARARFGVEPIPMDDVMKRAIHEKKEGNTVTLALIADQTPPNYPGAMWFEFMGRETIFFMGPEKIARILKMPVAFMHIDKFDNGRYKAWFEIIYDGQEELPKGEITRRYIERLDRAIRARPELWMWSHKRWKHKRVTKS